MKRLLALTLTLVLALTCTAVLATAEELTATVTVTVSKSGSLVLSAETVTVTDADGDGALTVSDALYAAHEAGFDGGAAAGYEAYVHKDYGLSLGKLWGGYLRQLRLLSGQHICMELGRSCHRRQLRLRLCVCRRQILFRRVHLL